MRKILNISIIITIIVGMLAVCVSHTVAEEIYVLDCIQEAIDFARNKDVIILRPGIYVENINYFGKAVTVRSTDPLNPDVVAVTIIDGGKKGSVVTFENREGNNSVLSGLTLQNGEACYGGGILCLGSSPTISYCNIIKNSSSNIGGGIYCSSSSPIITNCNIIENSSSNIGNEIYCSSSSPIFTNCIISRNSTLKHDGGIFCHEESPIINNCIITENLGLFNAGEIYFSSDSLPIITNCNFWNDLPQEEVYISESTIRVPYSNIQGVYSGSGNISIDPLFFNPKKEDSHLDHSIDPGYTDSVEKDRLTRNRIWNIYKPNSYLTTALQNPFLNYQFNLTYLPAPQIPTLNPLMVSFFNPLWYPPYLPALQNPFLNYQSNFTYLPALQIPTLNPLMVSSFNPLWYPPYPLLGYHPSFGAQYGVFDLDFQVNPALIPPDLVVESISISPEKPSPNETIEFTANFMNVGLNPAGSCRARFIIGDSNPPPYIIPELKFGKMHTLKRTKSFPIEQECRVRVIVDIYDNVDEYYERNNKMERIFQIFGPLNVMTLNARIPRNREPNSWPDRLPRIIKMLRLYESGLGPHIVGMQELEEQQWDDLRQHLPNYNAIRRDRGDGESVAIFYRPNRVELLNWNYFYLGIDDRRSLGSCPSINVIFKGEVWTFIKKDNNRRVVVWGLFKDKFTNKKFYVFNTHFPARHSCERIGSAVIMYRQVRQVLSQYPVIAMGDFNDGQNPDSEEYNKSFKILLRTPLKNSYREVHNFYVGEQFSTSNTDFKNKRIGEMVDFVLVSPSIHVVDANIDRTMFTSNGSPVICNQIDSQGRCTGTDNEANKLLMYSDHWAVWASLII